MPTPTDFYCWSCNTRHPIARIDPKYPLKRARCLATEALIQQRRATEKNRAAGARQSAKKYRQDGGKGLIDAISEIEKQVRLE